MGNPFRFVIVGAGNISRTYARAIGKVDGLELAGVVSRRSQIPEGAPPEVPVAASLDALNVPYDAVILATPNGVHHEGAVAAAALGKHVLTEKPLDISRAAMDQMIAACDEAGVKLGVCYQSRMNPVNRRLKEYLAAGVLGEVFATDVTIKYYRDQAYYDSAAYRGTYGLDGGGPFIQQGAHALDLYCWFFGLPETVLSMTDRFAHELEAEDHGAALLRHANGMIGTVVASTCTRPGFPVRFEIHGTRGSIVTENDAITFWDVDDRAPPELTKSAKLHDGRNTAAVENTVGHEAILADFAEAVRVDRDPAVPAKSARLATELVLRIYEAHAPRTRASRSASPT